MDGTGAALYARRAAHLGALHEPEPNDVGVDDKVLDAQGRPVSGVKIKPNVTEFERRFFYPGADLSSLGTVTSANGLFLYVHAGTPLVQQFNFVVEGRPEYKKRNAGAVNDACLVVMVTPGS